MIAPYGTWKSPITPSLITGESVGLAAIAFAGQDLCWLEQRPREAGRTVLVRNGADLTPPGYSVRSHVHEYGGGAFTVTGNDVIFVNDTDQQLYHAPSVVNRHATPLTNFLGRRFADMLIDRHRIIAVCEDHRGAGHEPVNSLVAITGNQIETLAACLRRSSRLPHMESSEHAMGRNRVMAR